VPALLSIEDAADKRAAYNAFVADLKSAAAAAVKNRWASARPRESRDPAY